MRYVIIRDDDTNALTPVECLERLYRPFLDRGFPVNLATIPLVSTTTKVPGGTLEGFLMRARSETPSDLPLTANPQLVSYLRENPGYRIVQHGLRHDYLEFDTLSYRAAEQRIVQGAQLLAAAGFPPARTFVAPYDKFSPGSFRAVAEHFQIISTGWFELRRLPIEWWPRYAVKKIAGTSHWRVGGTFLLSHPGCLLSCQRDYDAMLATVIRQLEHNTLTVLVTHWWEYFRGNTIDERFIAILHAVAGYLASQPDLKVLAFDEVLDGNLGPESIRRDLLATRPGDKAATAMVHAGGR